MNSPTPAAASFSPAKTPVAALIPLKAIEVRNQVRKGFDDADLQDLVASIKADGLLQPIIVRPVSTVQSGGNGARYELVAGERRLRASKLAGLTEIRAEVREGLDTAGVQILQLVENVQRADLSLQEQCNGVAALVKQLEGVDGKTGRQNAADKLGKSMGWVSKRAGIVEAPIEVKKLVITGVVVDAEIASGLSEFKQLVPKDKFERVLDDARSGARYGRAFTRDTIRELVKDAKDAKRRRDAAREQAKKDRAAGKTPKPVNSWQAQQAAERERQDNLQSQWKAGGAVVDKFATAAAKATGLVVESPRHDNYHCEAFPTSLEACEFKWDFNGTGAEAKQLASKTGLTLKLEISLKSVTPDQAVKVEQALGVKLKWGQEWSNKRFLTGKQLAVAAAKAGAKLELPDLPKPTAPKSAAKKKGR